MTVVALFVVPIVVSVIASLIITFLTNAAYWRFKRIPFQEQLKMDGCPQLFCYDIDNKNNLCSIISQAQECESFLGNIQQTNSGDANTRSTKIHFQNIDMSKLDFDGKSYRYFYLHNTSNITIQVAKIFDKEGFLIDLSDWKNQLINPKGSVGVFMLSYDAPKCILINYSGYEAEFQISDKRGTVPLVLRAKTKISKKRNA